MGTLYHLNVGCADASVIKTSSATFLIDCHNIEDHSYLLPANKKLRGVFITHQHEDHYSGLGYLKDEGYTIDHLIYSPYKRRWRYGDSSLSIKEWHEFKGYRDYFERRGTQLHTPYRQKNLNKPWMKTNGVSFTIVGPDKSIATSATRQARPV